MSQHQQPIRDMAWTLHRLLNKFNRLESTPMTIDGGPEITHRELHVIQAIGEMGPVNITQVAVHFGVTKSAASQLIGKLARKGLVSKEPAPNSGKELRLLLTATGQKASELHREHHTKNMNLITRRLARFSRGKIADTGRILAVIEGVLDERIMED